MDYLSSDNNLCPALYIRNRVCEICHRFLSIFLYSLFRASPLYINKIQQDATDAGIYLLHNYSTCFVCLSHPSSGVHQTVTAASSTGHITYQGNDLLPAWPCWQKVVALIRDMTCTRRCSYSLMYSC